MEPRSSWPPRPPSLTPNSREQSSPQPKRVRTFLHQSRLVFSFRFFRASSLDFREPVLIFCWLEVRFWERQFAISRVKVIRLKRGGGPFLPPSGDEKETAWEHDEWRTGRALVSVITHGFFPSWGGRRARPALRGGRPLRGGGPGVHRERRQAFRGNRHRGQQRQRH